MCIGSWAKNFLPVRGGGVDRFGWVVGAKDFSPLRGGWGI
jgi:hypothetical protein